MPGLLDNAGIARCPASTPGAPPALCPFEIKTDWQCGDHCFATGGLDLHYCLNATGKSCGCVSPQAIRRCLVLVGAHV